MGSEPATCDLCGGDVLSDTLIDCPECGKSCCEDCIGGVGVACCECENEEPKESPDA